MVYRVAHANAGEVGLRMNVAYHSVSNIYDNSEGTGEHMFHINTNEAYETRFIAADAIFNNNHTTTAGQATEELTLNGTSNGLRRISSKDYLSIIGE